MGLTRWAKNLVGRTDQRVRGGAGRHNGPRVAVSERLSRRPGELPAGSEKSRGHRMVGRIRGRGGEGAGGAVGPGTRAIFAHPRGRAAATPPPRAQRIPHSKRSISGPYGAPLYILRVSNGHFLVSFGHHAGVSFGHPGIIWTPRVSKRHRPSTQRTEHTRAGRASHANESLAAQRNSGNTGSVKSRVTASCCLCASVGEATRTVTTCTVIDRTAHNI